MCNKRSLLLHRSCLLPLASCLLPLAYPLLPAPCSLKPRNLTSLNCNRCKLTPE
ncbi:hypothetical protein [Moorena producens]|uniref:hypothetical protein n=1 Tax=Moorena producens TaxID=1155739 RepID=UPI000AC28BD2|nr:hypothetical protein [Moorena producens]